MTKLTQRMVEMRSQIMELAMLARTCTAPSTIHKIYATENTMVQIALKRNRIKLFNDSIQSYGKKEPLYSQ